MEQFKQWFGALSQRERLLVAAAGGLILFALVWLLGLQPLYSAKAQAALRVADKSALLSDLQRQAALVATGTTAQSVQGLDQSIVVVIDRTARLRKLSPYLKRNQPDGNNTVRLRFENAPFDDVLTWLSELQGAYGLSAESASFDQAGAPGRINCNLVLTRSGA